jgi:hypothetical protein
MLKKLVSEANRPIWDYEMHSCFLQTQKRSSPRKYRLKMPENYRDHY